MLVLIVNFKLTLERVCQNEWVTFQPTSTGLDNALVVCCFDSDAWLKCRSFVLANSLPSKFKVYYQFDSWSHEQYLYYISWCTCFMIWVHTSHVSSASAWDLHRITEHNNPELADILLTLYFTYVSYYVCFRICTACAWLTEQHNSSANQLSKFCMVCNRMIIIFFLSNCI